MAMIRATKDLVMNDGVKSFTKGNTYEVTNPPSYYQFKLSESTTVIDDQGDGHKVGNWLKFFKVVK